MTDFRADLSSIRDRVHGKLTQVCQETARVLYNEMSSGGKYSPGTPIKTGHHRRCWDAAIGGIPAGGDQGDPSGRIAAAIETFVPGETLYVTNNGPAIRRLEFGFTGTDSRGHVFAGFGPRSVNGRSSQAPDGFVRPAAEAIQPIVAEVAARLAGR